MVIVLRPSSSKNNFALPSAQAEAPALSHADCINGFVLFAAAKTLWGLYKMLLKIERATLRRRVNVKNTHISKAASHTHEHRVLAARRP